MTTTLDSQITRIPEGPVGLAPVTQRFEISVWRRDEQYLVEIPAEEADPLAGSTFAVVARALWHRHDGKRTVEAWDVTNPKTPKLIIAWTGMHDATSYGAACGPSAVSGTPFRGFFGGRREDFESLNPTHVKALCRIGLAKERRAGTGRYDPDAVQAVDRMALEFAPQLDAELAAWRVTPDRE